MATYAYRTGSRGTLWISALPGDGGVDWGYGHAPGDPSPYDHAVPLTPYWLRRARADARFCGYQIHAVTLNA